MKRGLAYLAVVSLAAQLGGCAGTRETQLLAREVAKYSAFLAEEISNHRKSQEAVAKERELILQELEQSVADAEKRYQLERAIRSTAFGSDYKSLEQSLTAWLNEISASRQRQMSLGKKADNEGKNTLDITPLLAFSKTMAELGRGDDTRSRIKFFSNYAKAVVGDVKDQKDTLNERFGGAIDLSDLNIFTVLDQQDDENE